MARRRLKVAFVVQRYGHDVVGGAETLCRSIAERMAAHWDVAVLTTTAKAYARRFENDMPPGETCEGGVPVRRFPIDRLRSDNLQFQGLDFKVTSRSASPEEEMEWLREVGPHSSDLLAHIAANKDAYDLFFFLTYLYATTTLAMPLVREKAILIPAAHDEKPIWAACFDRLLRENRGLVYSTEEERAFIHRRLGGPPGVPEWIVGLGFDIEPPLAQPPPLPPRLGLSKGGYMLYLGRVQKEKGCGELFHFFNSLPAHIRFRLPLVLAGSKAMEIPTSQNIRYLGFLPEDEKRAVLANAHCLVMPSAHESLSIVIIESWLAGVPVIVNGKSDVLVGQCLRANGGLWYADADEFQAVVEYMLDPANASALSAMAAGGRSYAEANYSWPSIIAKYLRIPVESGILPAP